METDHSRQAYTSMMKFTIDGRPYIKDIHDLFAALIVQIPLSTHRYLFRNYNNTFSCEEAITALGSLRFSHTVRTPDPNDPSRFTRTTTTTTFNMAKDMAKALCQQFQSCRLIQNAVDATNSNISDRTIWQLTPKGLCVLQDFCVRTEVDMAMMRKYFVDIRPIQLVRLERHGDDDQILVGRQHISLIFMVMVSSLPMDDTTNNNNNNNNNNNSSSQHLPVPPLSKSSSAKKDGNTNNSNNNVGSSGSSVSSSGSSGSSSSPSTLAPFTMSTHVVNGDSRVQLLGNYLLTLSAKNGKNPSANATMAANSNIKLSNKKMRTIFSTQLACDWLIDYSTVSSYEEGEVLLSEFIKYGWLEYQDSKYEDQYIRISKSVLLVITNKGKQIIMDTHQQQQSSNKSNHHTNNNNNNNNNNDKDTLVNQNHNSHNNENDEATLHEILKQDPESVMITTTTTSTNSSSENVLPRRHNSTSSNNNSNKSRPPSAAMDYSPPPAIIASVNKVDVKESNAVKLKQILDDAQLRSLFKDFLRQNFCEENLDFWIDYSTLKRKLRNQSPALPSQNQKDLLEDAYDLWATYLKPGASSELNVEHSLRQEMARVVNAMVTVVPTYVPGTQSNSKTALVMSSHSVSQALRMILKWLDQVNDHICRLMATDSVPKFARTSKYRKIIEQREKEEDIDIVDLQQQRLDHLFLDKNNNDNDTSSMNATSTISS
ncbi:regulator of G protein signaling domain-containing protein [Cunninghamella echinulata]|nr:regulator of G protein signaling domain-containing protein [Cunninghamella echinulata]